MISSTGKAAKVLVLSAATVLALAVGASAAEGTLATGAGCTTGSDLRMRAEASTDSAVVTMLDKSTPVAILDKQNGWYYVGFNGKTGYVSADYLIEDQDGLFTCNGRVNADGVNVRVAPSTEAQSAATVDRDAYLTVNGIEDGWYAVTCQYGTTGYVRSDFIDLTNSDGSASNADAVELARQHLGTRYAYGGASPGGFDCSGFTMYIFKQLGVNLPHSATSQWQSGLGEQITSAAGLQAGDLVFFCDPSRSLGKACSHAGIYIGGGQFIHASSANSGGVIISTLSSGYYNNYFVGGLRV